tara:strand:+ start:371 stop:805 length:435 start_codon:yes stop_codon:yes gene_type:complete
MALEKRYKIKVEENKIITDDHFIINGNRAYAGQHIIIDFWYTNFDNKISSLRKIIKKAVMLSNATLINLKLHRFGEEQGISGVAVLAESHISVHTWPERDYIAFDIFMCGNTNPEIATKYLISSLNPKEKFIKIIKRGEHKIDK